MLPSRALISVRGAAAAAILSAAAAAGQTPPGPNPPLVTAGPFDGTVQLDGVLDEPAWAHGRRHRGPRPAGAQARRADALPHGGPHPRRRRNLYFGITCIDPDPSLIAVHTMQRDGNMSGDDTISIVLDTFHDHRTGYLFEVNCGRRPARRPDLGPERGEGLARLGRDLGRRDPPDARRVDRGDRPAGADDPLQPHDAEPWGFNIQRYVARELLTLRWTGTTLDANLLDMRRAGNLDGVGCPRPGMGPDRLALRPGPVRDHITGPTRFTQGQAGVDVGYHVTSQLDGVLTVNPDFAEVEADSRQVNLTRFALFFPEKRPFFTDGANFFDFGLELQDTFIPFYSRRVGLFDDRIIPITVGAERPSGGRVRGASAPSTCRRATRSACRRRTRRRAASPTTSIATCGSERSGPTAIRAAAEQLAGRRRRGLADRELPGRQEPRLRTLGRAQLRRRRTRRPGGLGTSRSSTRTISGISRHRLQGVRRLARSRARFPSEARHAPVQRVCRVPAPAFRRPLFRRAAVLLRAQPGPGHRPPRRDRDLPNTSGSDQLPDAGRATTTRRTTLPEYERLTGALRDRARRRHSDRELPVPPLPGAGRRPRARGPCPSARSLVRRLLRGKPDAGRWLREVDGRLRAPPAGARTRKRLRVSAAGRLHRPALAVQDRLRLQSRTCSSQRSSNTTRTRRTSA